MILYFVDNMVEGVYDKKTFSYVFRNSVLKGQIVNKEEFIVEFNSLLKKEKIKSKFFGIDITIIKEPFYTPSYLFYLENILEELGFVKVNYILMEDMLDKNDTYIEINNSYICIFANKKIYIDLDVFKDIPFIIKYFDMYYNGNIIMFGKNKNIPQIKINNKLLYYYDDFANFVVKCLHKVNKYGV